MYFSDQKNGLNSFEGGFTLIETIIYIAFLGLILSGVIVATYPLFSGAERMSEKTTRDTESAFAVQKIGWMLSSVNTVTKPPANSTGNTLGVRTHDGHTLTLEVSGGELTLSEDGGTPLSFSAERVEFSDLEVIHTGPAPDTLRKLVVSFKANGVDVGPLIYYVRN